MQGSSWCEPGAPRSTRRMLSAWPAGRRRASMHAPPCHHAHEGQADTLRTYTQHVRCISALTTPVSGHGCGSRCSPARVSHAHRVAVARPVPHGHVHGGTCCRCRLLRPTNHCKPHMPLPSSCRMDLMDLGPPARLMAQTHSITTSRHADHRQLGHSTARGVHVEGTCGRNQQSE